MLEPLMYTGGIYRHDELIELVEDLGGHVLQKNVMQLEVVLLILVPADDISAVEEKAGNSWERSPGPPLSAPKSLSSHQASLITICHTRRATSQNISEEMEQKRISLA